MKTQGANTSFLEQNLFISILMMSEWMNKWKQWFWFLCIKWCRYIILIFSWMYIILKKNKIYSVIRYILHENILCNIKSIICILKTLGKELYVGGGRLLSTSNKISLLVYFQTLEAKKKIKNEKSLKTCTTRKKVKTGGRGDSNRKFDN